MEHVNVGEQLQTPLGATTIIAIDAERMLAVTERGKWPLEDIARFVPLLAAGRDTLEAWLESGASWSTDTLPLQKVQVETIECKVFDVDCSCSACHTRVHRLRGIIDSTYHEIQNAHCHCLANGCACLS